MSGVHASRRRGFIENTIDGLHAAMERALSAEDTAAGSGLLQRMDARVKLLGIGALIVSAAMSARLSAIAAILALALVLALASRVSFWMLASRVWLGALLFTGPLAIPAMFLTPGARIVIAPALDLAVTAQGLRTAAFLLLRVETTATLALILIFTTPWMHVLKALRVLRAPVVFVVILGMTCRYILLMLQTAHAMFESRQSRTVGKMNASDHRRLAASSAGVLLGKTYQLSGEIYLAMQARGFRGEVYLLDDFSMRAFDWAALTGFAGLAAVSIWMGR